MGAAWWWVAAFFAWCAAEQVAALFWPIEVDAEHLEWLLTISLMEKLLMGGLVGPAVEEIIFRGVLFSALLKRWGLWAAVILPSLAWGVLHYQYSWWYMISIGGSGVVLAMLRWKSGSIYPPLAAHAVFNVVVTLFGDVPQAAP